MGSAATPAMSMREMLREVIRSYSSPRPEAIARAARQIGVPARRVRAVLDGEVGRVWADEWEAVQAWHGRWLARQEQALELERAHVRARLDEHQRKQNARLETYRSASALVDRQQGGRAG